jgi:hypothetical protein
MVEPRNVMLSLRRMVLTSLLVILATPVLAQSAAPAGQPTMQERIANLKEWMKASQIELHKYEWIETTTVSHAGEVKSTTVKSCYYDVNGQLEKVQDSDTKASGGLPGILPPGRLLKRVGEHKADEIEAYIKSAVSLIHTYVPPDPNAIQLVVNNGNMSMQMLEPGRKIQLTFNNYKLQGDSLSFQMELPTNQLLGFTVSTYVDDPQDVVTLTSTTSVLPDGTIYISESVLNAPSKNVEVTIQNSGYHLAQGE